MKSIYFELFLSQKQFKMKRGLFIVFITCLFLFGCKEKTDWGKVRELPSTQSLLSEIEERDDVAKAIISDAGGLCVAMHIGKDKAEYVAPYFLRMAKSKNVKIKFCKIVSAIDYKSDGTYMTGTKLAFDNQK